MGEEQGQQPADAETAQQPKGKPFGAGFFVILIVAVAAALAGLYYQEEIHSIILLKPWDKAGPRSAVDAWAAAIQANDRDALQAVSARELSITMEGDKIGGISQGGMLQPNQAEELLPGGPTDDVPVTFDLRKDKRFAQMMMPAADGGTLVFYAVPADGRWKILSWSRSRPKAP